MLDVHDDVAQAEEVLLVQRLGEEVGEVVVRVDERHSKTMVLSRFSFSAVVKRTRSATYRCRCPRARLHNTALIQQAIQGVFAIQNGDFAWEGAGFVKTPRA